MITLTIISFSSGLDSAIMMVRATKVWSSRVLIRVNRKALEEYLQRAQQPIADNADGGDEQ